MSRRSNEDLWNENRKEGDAKFRDYFRTHEASIARYIAAIRADEAEHIKEEQRRIDAPAVKLCPFCGINASITFKKGAWQARCRSCGMGGRGFDTDAAAVAAWNKRV